MIHVVVTIDVKPDRLADFLALVDFHAAKSRLEPGCHKFDVFRCFTAPHRYMLQEAWYDKRALDDHKQTPHYQRWRSEIADIEAGPREHFDYESLDLTPAKASRKIDRLEMMQRASAHCYQRVVMAPGCFDLLGPHHVQFLARAKRLGTMLVVALNDDASVRRLKGPSRPIVSCYERALQLASLECVDWVLTFPEDDPRRLVEIVKPALIVKGDEVRPGGFPEAGNVPVKILPAIQDRSTSKTIMKIRRRICASCDGL